MHNNEKWKEDEEENETNKRKWIVESSQLSIFQISQHSCKF